LETYTQITIIRLISKFIIFKFFQNSLPELLFLSIHLYQIWELVLCRVCVFVSSTLEMIWSWWFYVYDIACKLQHRYDIVIPCKSFTVLRRVRNCQRYYYYYYYSHRYQLPASLPTELSSQAAAYSSKYLRYHQKHVLSPAPPKRNASDGQIKTRQLSDTCYKRVVNRSGCFRSYY